MCKLHLCVLSLGAISEELEEDLREEKIETGEDCIYSSD